MLYDIIKYGLVATAIILIIVGLVSRSKKKK